MSTEKAIVIHEIGHCEHLPDIRQEISMRQFNSFRHSFRARGEKYDSGRIRIANSSGPPERPSRK